MTPHSTANCSPAIQAKAPTSTPVARLICVLTSMYLRIFCAVAALAASTMRAVSRLV